MFQLVAQRQRAWHACKSCWAGDIDMNAVSIGIEVANAGHPGGLPAFTAAQVESVIGLCRDCGERWGLAPERVLGHSDVAPVRTVDPGENFPWAQLHAAGVGHWVAPAPLGSGRQIGRPSCMARVCKYVSPVVVPLTIKKKNT